MAVASDDLLSEKAAAMRASLERSQAITDDVVSILGSFDHRLSALETAMRPTQVALSTQNRFFWIGSLLFFWKNCDFDCYVKIFILFVTAIVAVSKIATKLRLQSWTETLFVLQFVAAFVCNFLQYQNCDKLWLQSQTKTFLGVSATATVAAFVCHFLKYQRLSLKPRLQPQIKPYLWFCDRNCGHICQQFPMVSKIATKSLLRPQTKSSLVVLPPQLWAHLSAISHSIKDCGLYFLLSF